jgi:hypothetical protein
MIKDRHIKPHDFVSGKPKSFWWSAIPSTNPCYEIMLGTDPIDCVLGGGFETGELGVIMSSPSVGRTITVRQVREYLNNVQEQPSRDVVNLDYMALYPQTQNTERLLSSFYEERRRYREIDNTQRNWAKIMLNSNY